MRCRLTGVALVAATLAWVAEARASASPPRRIVSINLCSDQILLDLVPAGRIAALSHLAADPAVSPVAERAAQFPLTRGEAELVLAFEPDLVLVGAYSTPATTALLQRLKIKVEMLPLALDIDGIRTSVRQLAKAVGEVARGEAVVAEFDRRLTAAAPLPNSARPKALLYQVNGIAGSDGLAQAAMMAAGIDDHARALGLGSSGALSLEALVAHPPDMLLLADPIDQHRNAVADNLRHPALAAVLRERSSLVLPARYWLCGSPYLADAVERLATARASLAERTRR